MNKTSRNYFTVFSLCFIIAWLSTIFYFDKNDFDIIFREKGTAIATIVDFSSEEFVYEYEEDRRASSYTVDYIVYTYFVEGIKYKNFCDQFDETYLIGAKITVEYAKSNPKSSRIPREKANKFSFFTRNLFMVTFFSFLAMLAVIYAWDILNKRDPGWR